MKKFGLFISIALLTAFVGCDSDDVEDPVVPAVSKPVVAVSENTPTSFGVEWDAVDEAAGYQYVVTESDAAGNTSEFCPETQTDKTSLRFDDAAAGAKYTVKVKALAAADSQLADSEYAEIFVETPAKGLSSQTFAFTVDPVGYDSATVKVEPSIADETYFFAVVKSSLLLDKNSNAIIEMLKKDIEPESLIKGEQTIETKWLDPETAYVAVAFGYDADRGASTSVLSRSEKFSTAVDPRMSIDVSVMNAGDEAISAKCVPSGSGSYFVTAVKSADVAGMSDREILDAQLAALNAEIDKSGWDAVAAAQFRSGTSNYNASGLSIGTEYSVVAFGVQKSAAGKAEETTRLFKANTKTTSPEAKVQLTYVIDDGDKYVYVDPDFAGKAVMLFDLVPNEATAKWAVGCLFYETVLEMPEADIIAFMLGDPANLYTDALTDRVVPLEWGEVLYVTTIGVNAAGVTGPLSMTRVEAVMDGNQGGDEPTPPTTERSNASVGLSNSLFNDEGNPAAQITFSPNSDCASFRFMIGYGPGLVEEAGEEAMIAAFGDESLNMSTNPEGLWYDSSVLQGSNGAVFTFVKDALGATVCNYALAYDAEGVPGKISVDTMQFPASLDDLPTSPSSAPTSSMMFHTRYRHLAAIELIDRTSRLKVSNLK